MNNQAPKPCRHAGCGVLVVDGSGLCQAHLKSRRAASDQQRGSSTERGYGGQWRKARAGYLRSHPLCVVCATAGVVRAANVVDHIVPHKGDQALFWDKTNWQSLCKSHHDAKTAREDGGWGRG
ncbi:HNH endonuclease [Sulfuriferula sp.]|uniref:HNH endonuclease n=1 Tax=Sulfuriferula sp. TaxID=2025307 RepID=UPI0027315695|nr:HNH endonuclease [Sulfuriferula sp.]MDP2026435.1 HNH endonuclease [Sulfuriferula sp.]